MTSALLGLVLTASATHLGVYVASDDVTSQTLLAACPPVAVFPLATGSVPVTQIGQFRVACPGSRVIAQVGGTGLTVDASTASARWATDWLMLLNQVGLSNIDAVEGPSEPYASFDTLAAFWSSFADLVHANTGKLPVVGSLPMGTTTTAFCATATAMASRTYAWAWSYHAFSSGMTQSTATEPGVFAYRALVSGCHTGSVPVYLTQLGTARSGGWAAGDVDWLAWVDGQLGQDAELVAAAVYEAGGTRSLTPIAADLAAYFRNPSPTDGGVPDGSTDGGAPVGGAPGGGIVTGGPPGNYPSSGCASAGAGAGLALALVAALAVRRRRQGVKR